MFFIDRLDRGVPQTINNCDYVPIGLWAMSHESLEIGFWKPTFQHHFIKLCPHKSLSFNVLRLHITSHYGQHFTIHMIVHMTNRSCPTSNTFHMIKHDPNILQILYRLHLCDEVDSTFDTIYRHIENKYLLSMNLFWETTLMDVVIVTLGLQFKDAINIATSWMMLERSNKVKNVGRTKFT